MLEYKDNDYLRLIDEAFAVIDRNRANFEELELIFEGEYPKHKLEELKFHNLSAIFVPLARDCVTAIAGQFVSAFFQGKSPIEFTGEQKEEIALMNQYISQEVFRAKPTTELEKAFINTLVYGFACVMVRWDEVKKIPITTCLPIDCFALDPKATSLKDSKYCCYRQSIAYIDAKEMFGDKVKVQKAKYDRITMKEIYTTETLEVEGKKIKYWKIKTFIENDLVREDWTTRLPFYYGYSIVKIPKRNRNPNFRDIDYFGKSLIDLLSSYQDELNKKRNQKSQSDDLQINPRVLYTGGFPIDIASSGAGGAFETDDLNSFKIFDTGTKAVNIDRDIEILSNEAMRAAGLSSVNMGVTGASDRRSFTALSFISATSGVRIELQIVTVLETLFHNWAIGFVEEIRTRSNDYLLSMIDTNRMKIHFGSPISVAQRKADLREALEVISNDPSYNPDLKNDIMVQYLTICLGEDYDPQKFFKKTTPEQMGIL